MNNIKLTSFLLSKKSLECLKIISFSHVIAIILIIYIISYSSFPVIIDSMYSVTLWEKKIKKSDYSLFAISFAWMIKNWLNVKPHTNLMT